ncbi:hypothetical protein DFR29_103151 [Tahibacter aquaticus]|uniref:Uncharacterized protein n=1 Tax=Tahibacter aquaticus TaxID=520092 RepID=A0A4R6Z4K5_9GAMM|nr:hypothetical protein [Tahibacter aquaticus]TDR46617.1 hypothetical protein DFR29_103151 [Tahibacter aquaticus]
MAWWNEIRDMVRQELAADAPPRTHAEKAPSSLHQAQLLLQRTARELAEARQRAGQVARRLGKAQQQLEALTQVPQSHPRYRERLIELARSIARDSDLSGSFRAHLSQLDLLHDQVSRQLRELDHDLSMARAVSAIGQATQAQATRRRTAAAAGSKAARTPKTPASPAASKSAAGTPAAKAAKKTAAAKSARTKTAPAGSAGFRRARASRVIDALEKVPAARRPGPARED